MPYSFILLNISRPAFNKKFQGMLKGKKQQQTNIKTSNLKRQSIRARLKYGRDFGIIRLGI